MARAVTSKTKPRKTVAKRPAVEIAVDAPTVPVAATANPYLTGERVIHAMFGEGLVVATREDAVTIKFKTGGVREIRSDFIKRG